MTRLGTLFFGIFLTLAMSWAGLVLSSFIQFGDLQPIALEEGGIPKPQQRSGMAQKGREVYADLGCIYCHSQQVRRKGYGADFERGWGDRQTVARDYILEPRVMLGTSRTGPDLTNVGRRRNGEWQHLHLYNPQITSPGSIMPPFAYLYRIQKIENGGSPDALKIPPGDAFAQYQPPAGFEIVPTERAILLVEYLNSLNIDYELPESKNAE